MELHVSAKAIPYTILAVLSASADLQKSVKVVFSNDAAEPKLTLNNGSAIRGEASVARYLIRSAQLLNEKLPEAQKEARLVDTLMVASAEAAAALVKGRQAKYLLGNEPSLADLLAWGVLYAGQSPEATYGSEINAVKDALVLAKEAANVQPAAATAVEIEGSRPNTNPMDAFKNAIASQISSLSGVSAKLIYDALDLPRATEHGDLAVAVPRLRVKGNPAALAQQWADAFVPSDYVLGATAIGPFLNFRINHRLLLANTLKLVAEKKEKYGTNDLGNGKRIIVEFSSPNIAKPFHAGHLRSTIIGSFIYNVYKANGWETISMNYLGDWGKQYGLLAVGFDRYGDEAKLLADPIKHLFDVYVQINRDAETAPEIHDEARAYFKQMEDGEEKALALWRRFRDLSIVKYRDIYARLNIQFDVYSGESQVSNEKMNEAMKKLADDKLLEDSEGAKVIDLTEYKLGKTVVQKRDGTTLYLTRDIGGAWERYEKYKFDKMIYVVASQQDLHLKQLFKTIELMGFEWANRLEHINFGLVQGMSTRKGNVVFLEDILNDARDIMHDVMRKNEAKYAEVANPEQVADEIGLSAVKIQDNSARRIKNYDFDPNRMFSFEGDTGPYIQYAHARLMSVERKSGLQVNFNANLDLLTEPTALEVVRTVAQYPDLIKGLTNGLEPCNVVTYAFKLSHDISACFENLWVRGAAPDVAEARLFMYWAARVTLGNAMRLLGLRPLERM
ncbi:hypothetical protein BX666DRAFT_2017740 [Dichotomocladium elegans]|nr:hypothetical protein BX666DRAFT_2017740 [Dichotomocladium elegans]